MTDYTFFREETGKTEKVAKERWCWVAVYNDGTVLRQFDFETYTFHQIKEIDQSKLSEFMMIHEDGRQLHKVQIKGNRRFIHFYRHVVLGYNTANPVKIKLYCFGYQYTNVFGRNKKVINVILPDDKMVTVDDMSKLRIE
jgi:hypothetical protein